MSLLLVPQSSSKVLVSILAVNVLTYLQEAGEEIMHKMQVHIIEIKRDKPEY